MFLKKTNNLLTPSNARNKTRTALASLPVAITFAMFLFPQTAYSASSNTQTATNDTNMSMELTALTDKQQTALDAIAEDRGLPVENLYKLFKAVKHEFPNENDQDLFELISEAIEAEQMGEEIIEALNELEAEITEAIEIMDEIEELEKIDTELTEAIEAIEEIDTVVTEAAEEIEAIEEVEVIEELEKEIKEIEKMEAEVEALTDETD